MSETNLLAAENEKLRSQHSKTLRENEERFRAIFDSSKDAIVATDSTGIIIYWNTAAENIFGFTNDEIIGRPVEIIIPENARLQFRSGITHVLDQGSGGATGYPGELVALKKDGSQFPIEISHSNWHQDGTVFFSGIIRDISQRKKNEEELRQSKLTLENAQKLAHIGSWEMDLEKGTYLWSDELYRLLGYAPAEIQPAFEVLASHMHPDDRKKMAESHENYAAGTLEYEEQYRIVRKDGKLQYCAALSNINRDAGGKAVRAYGTIQDITEKKLSEQQLQDYRDHLEEIVRQRTAELAESEERLRSILETAGDSIISVNSSGIIISWNAAAEKLYGYTAAETIGQHFTMTMDPKFGKRHNEMLEHTLSGTLSVMPQTAESVIQRKDGSICPVEVSIALFKVKGETFITSIARNISFRKHAEKQLKEQEHELAEKVIELEEINTALKVLIKKSDEDRKELEDKILHNINILIGPYIENLKNAHLAAREKAFVNILDANIQQITKSFTRTLTSPAYNLTNAEIQVANLIKEGKTSKNIAEFLNISVNTVAFHRNNIRKKIRIKEQGNTQLKTFLSNI